MAGRAFTILAGILCVVWCGSLCSSFAQDNEAKHGKEIRALLAERRDTLRLRLETVDVLYRSGKVGIERVISANNDLLEAELELCSSQAEKVEVSKKRLDNLRALEKIVLEKHASGIESRDNQLLTTAARIGAEIGWLRQREGRNG